MICKPPAFRRGAPESDPSACSFTVPEPQLARRSTVTLRCEDASLSFMEESSMQGIFVGLTMVTLGLLVAQWFDYVVGSKRERKATLQFAAFSKDLPPPEAAPPSAEITVEYDRAA
jgi:hypothetical protein